MHRRLASVILALAVCAIAPVRGTHAAGPADGDAASDAVTLRVFLKDGNSLVSYGEPARVGDRVVFSMPTTGGGDLQLHLVNLAADRVDWDRTARYADSARAARYLATQAGYDYAELSTEVADALSQVAATTNPLVRADVVRKARTLLVEWPPKHYGYKQSEILQMLGMLDEAIADLRPTPGAAGFSLNFVSITPTPPPTEPLLPNPSPQQAIDQVLLAAKLADEPAERSSLLTTALKSLDHDRERLPKEWATATAAATSAALAREQDTDGAYRRMSDRILALAKTRTKNADVRGVERLLTEMERRDQALGSQRADVVKALLDSLGSQLDDARRLRLARDQWALRAEGYRQYRRAMTLSMARFSRLRPALDDIKGLAGSAPDALATVERLARRIQKSIADIMPPDELVEAHALLVSAADLALNAAGIRREAALANNLSRAWDASAAAAGSLMLTARARAEMQNVTRYPQLAQVLTAK